MKNKFQALWATCILFSIFSCIACNKDRDDKSGAPKTYLLVHGTNHGAWAWKKVVPMLKAQGHRVQAIDLPSHGNDKTPPENVTIEDYVQRVVDFANAQPGPVILVGHSSGGITIAQASERLGTGKVEKLIFLDAFLPNNGESAFALAAKFLPPSPAGKPAFSESFLFDATGATFSLDTTTVANFLYHDCAPADVSFAKANLGKQPVAPFATPVQVTDSIYGVISKFYILCSEARNGDMTQMSKNVPMQKVVTLAAGHSPFFSQPEALVKLITDF